MVCNNKKHRSGFKFISSLNVRVLPQFISFIRQYYYLPIWVETILSYYNRRYRWYYFRLYNIFQWFHIIFPFSFITNKHSETSSSYTCFLFGARCSNPETRSSNTVSHNFASPDMFEENHCLLR